MKIIAEEKITIPQSLPLGWPSGETKAYCDGIQYPMRPDTIGNRLMKTFHYSTTGDKLLRVSPKKMHWIRQANEKPKHSNFYNNTIRQTHFGQSKNTPTSWRTKRTLKRIQKKKKRTSQLHFRCKQLLQFQYEEKQTWSENSLWGTAYELRISTVPSGRIDPRSVPMTRSAWSGRLT